MKGAYSWIGSLAPKQIGGFGFHFGLSRFSRESRASRRN